jgi:hypothetical protein
MRIGWHSIRNHSVADLTEKKFVSKNSICPIKKMIFVLILILYLVEIYFWEVIKYSMDQRFFLSVKTKEIVLKFMVIEKTNELTIFHRVSIGCLYSERAVFNLFLVFVFFLLFWKSERVASNSSFRFSFFTIRALLNVDWQWLVTK